MENINKYSTQMLTELEIKPLTEKAPMKDKYKIISASSESYFTDGCNRLMNEGYIPNGNMITSHDSYGSISKFAQSFILKEENLGTLKQEFTAIPYQICPKCNGSGTITLFPTYTEAQNGIKEENIICDICKGDKLIPMFIKKY